MGRIVGNAPRGKLFDVRGGYTLADASKLRKLDAVLTQLTEEGKLDDVRAALRVGVHSDVQVTSCRWGSSRVEDAKQVVTQVFGSACAVAYNGNSDSRSWRNFASIILEASYEATLWAALLNAHEHRGQQGSNRVFLTCLGGGVFGNSMAWIMQAMRRAFELFKECDLDVRVITYAGPVDPQLLAIADEFVAKALQAEKKRLRVEEGKDGALKRPKVTLLPDVTSLSGDSSTVGESTPAGRRKESDGCPNSPPKDDTVHDVTKRKGRHGKAEKVPVLPQPKLDATVLNDAERLGYAASLINLASRPEILARRLPARVLLEALKRSDGLVNKAKNSLLAA